MRVLITGATGFVGGYLATELAAHYPEAVLFGTTFGPSTGAPLPPKMTLIEADLREPSVLAQVVEEAASDHVFHLAGFASAAGTDAARIHAANVGASVALLEALAEAGRPCRVQLASTGYVYGATAPGHPATEASPLQPDGPYAQSKAAMEAEVAPFASATLSLTVTRAFNHTGPRQTAAFVVPAFARQLARIEAGLDAPVVRVGNLSARRDFLDVRDVVRAYRLLLCALPATPLRTVNVCSGEATAVQTVLDTLVAHARVPVTVEPDPARMRPADMPECVGDPALLTQLTGWRKAHALTETLAETLSFWRRPENLS